MADNDKLEVHASWKCKNCGMVAYSLLPHAVCPMCDRPAMFPHDVATEADMGDIEYRRGIIAGLQAAVTEILEKNIELDGRLKRVRDRCESNNWMGTARLCGEGNHA